MHPTATAVISDLHIGAGSLDDCDATLEAALIAFLAFLSEMNRPVELVLNGDFLDFAQAPPIDGAELHGQTADGVSLCFTEMQSLAKFTAIRDAHAEIFAAMVRFVARNEGHRIVVIPGNHDADFFWPAVRGSFMDMFHSELHPRVTFHLEQCYRPAQAPNLWIEHGHQYDACNRFVVAGADLWSAKHPPILLDTTGTPRLLECIGTRFMTRFLNRLDDMYPFVDNVKPLGRFLKLFGPSAFVPRHGPTKAMIAVWAMVKYLAYTTFTTPADLLGHQQAVPPNAKDVVRALVDRMPDRGDQLVQRLQRAGFPMDRPLAMFVHNEQSAERLLDFLAEHLELLGNEGAPLGSLLDASTPGTLSLWKGFKLDESDALRKAASRIARTEPVDGIVMGHTHEFVDTELDRAVHYVNIGSWTRYLREEDPMMKWDILLRGQDARFPYRLCYAWHDPTADRPLRAIIFDESGVHGRV